MLSYSIGIMDELLENIYPSGQLDQDKIKDAVERLSQWHSEGAPRVIQPLPYPYRLRDTVENYHRLYENILSDKG